MSVTVFGGGRMSATAPCRTKCPPPPCVGQCPAPLCFGHLKCPRWLRFGRMSAAALCRTDVRHRFVPDGCPPPLHVGQAGPIPPWVGQMSAATSRRASIRFLTRRCPPSHCVGQRSAAISRWTTVRRRFVSDNVRRHFASDIYTMSALGSRRTNVRCRLVSDRCPLPPCVGRTKCPPPPGVGQCPAPLCFGHLKCPHWLRVGRMSAAALCRTDVRHRFVPDGCPPPLHVGQTGTIPPLVGQAAH